MSTSSTGRQRNSSRTAPPTTQASSPARISLASSSIGNEAFRPRWRGVDPGRGLVVDGAGDMCMLLEKDAVTDERNLRADRKLARQLDRDRVHRHRSYLSAALPVHQDLGAGEVTAETVRVADRDD